MRPVFAALALLLMTVIPAAAEPLAQDCAYPQADMAGVYIDMASPMRVEMFPCGGVSVLWDNDYGRHMAFYGSHARLPGGGVIANGLKPDPSVGYPDNAYTIGLKPAEPGYLQAITISPYGEFTGFYRLRKVS